MSIQKNNELTTFMLNKNAEAKGQKIKKKAEKKEEEDSLPDKPKPTRKTTEAPVRKDEGLILLRKIMNIIIMVPVIVTGIASFSYFMIKILPPVIGFIRKLLILLMMGK